MKKATSKIESVTARELMQKKVIKIEADAPVEDALEILESNRISGAPVVDSGGRLVGVISARDIARREHMNEGRLDDERREYYLSNAVDEELIEDEEDESFQSKSSYSPGVASGSVVADWMNDDVITVIPGATLVQICSVMARESIHRVLVVEKETLVGIVSTFDIVRFIAEVAAPLPGAKNRHQ